SSDVCSSDLVTFVYCLTGVVSEQCVRCACRKSFTVPKCGVQSVSAHLGLDVRHRLYLLFFVRGQVSLVVSPFSPFKCMLYVYHVPCEVCMSVTHVCYTHLLFKSI